MIDSPRRVLAVTAVLTVVFVASALDAGGTGGTDLPWDVVLLALNTLPLLAIGRNPLVVVLVFCLAYPAWLETGHDAHLFQSLPTLTALYALGSWSRPARGGPGPAEPVPLWVRSVGLVAPAWMLTAALLGWWADADLLDLGYVAVMFVLVWALGVVLAARRSYARQLEAKTGSIPPES